MKTITAVLAVSALLAPITMAQAQGTGHFAFRAEGIGGTVSMTGGGAYDPRSGFLQGGGTFRTTSDITAGPLAGLRAGEGVRWEAAQILPSSGFKCGGSANEPLKAAVTDNDTVVMQVRFYRAGDGGTTPFTAKVFVSAADENPDQPGIQNIWIQGVGCAQAAVNFR
jgi:hypothetical protein